MSLRASKVYWRISLQTIVLSFRRENYCFREMQAVNVSRTDYKLLFFLKQMLLKIRKYKIQPNLFKMYSGTLNFCLKNLLYLWSRVSWSSTGEPNFNFVFLVSDDRVLLHCHVKELNSSSEDQNRRCGRFRCYYSSPR